MRLILIATCLLMPVWAYAQELETDRPARVNKQVSTSAGAVMRVIDRVAGRSETITVQSGQSVRILDSVLYAVIAECRYYTSNPAGEAFAFIEVMDAQHAQQLFNGWMIASSPALNALEHNRYDIWPLRCITS